MTIKINNSHCMQHIPDSHIVCAYMPEVAAKVLQVLCEPTPHHVIVVLSLTGLQMK